MNNRLQFHEKVYYFYRSDVLSAQGLVYLPYTQFCANFVYAFTILGFNTAIL